jgi:hypothetical protein
MTRQKQNKAKNRVEMAIRVEMFIATCKLFTMRFFNVKVVSHSQDSLGSDIINVVCKQKVKHESTCI